MHEKARRRRKKKAHAAHCAKRNLAKKKKAKEKRWDRNPYPEVREKYIAVSQGKVVQRIKKGGRGVIEKTGSKLKPLTLKDSFVVSGHARQGEGAESKSAPSYLQR